MPKPLRPRAIGVVGPRDLLDQIVGYCHDVPGLEPLHLPYAAETQAAELVEHHAARVDGWLFTGIVPYTLAERAGRLDRPAVYVRYTGEALQQAMIRMLREGRDIERISVDTMSRRAVSYTFERADAPSSLVRVLPHGVELGAADYADFHRKAHEAGTTYAVTCLSSTYDLIRDELPSLRLRPSRHAVRSALQQLTLALDEDGQDRSHVVLGLVETRPDRTLPAGELARELAALDGAVGEVREGLHVVATTRGRLADVSADGTDLPQLHRLAERVGEVWMGFGHGHSAAEAEHFARRALARARRLGGPSAVMSRRHGGDLVLASSPRDDATTADLPLETLAETAGVAVQTIERLRAVGTDEPVTPGTVAAHLGLQVRSARRILHQLLQVGLATKVGETRSGTRGRPSTLYRLRLPREDASEDAGARR